MPICKARRPYSFADKVKIWFTPRYFLILWTMKLKSRIIAFILLSIIVSLIVERAIPHTHHKIGDTIVIDFDENHNNKDSDKHNEHELEEIIHSSVYQISDHKINFSVISEIINIQFFEFKEVQTELPVRSDFNILPKILNTLLFIINTYSSKAPPF